MASVELDPRTAPTLVAVQSILADFLADTHGERPAGIDPQARLTDLATNSMQLLQVHARLEDTLDLEIPASALFDHDTVAALVQYLIESRS